VCLGVTLDNEVKGRSNSALAILGHIFLFLFTTEFLLNVAAYGPAIVTHGWHLFDLVIILGGVISQWTLGPFIGHHPVVQGVEQMLILRMMRLLRLVRAVRLVTSFRALWKLTNSFLLCAPTMMSAFTLMFIILYIFACIGADFIAKAEWTDPALAELVRTHFATLPRTLLSLVQFVTGDSVSSIYFPLVVNKPVLCIYFVALIMMVTLALMYRRGLRSKALCTGIFDVQQSDGLHATYGTSRPNSVMHRKAARTFCSSPGQACDVWNAQ